jgi:pimeloyl-ACP methyl ester carboxylesterase
VTDLAVEVVGDGETVVLVHGSGFRDSTWSEQRPLAERYRLLIPFRRGYGSSPPADPDFQRDAEDIAELLRKPAHLVGYSYGGIGVLLAAAKRPDRARSVTAIEPPILRLSEASPARELLERLTPVYERAPQLTPEEFDSQFDATLGFDHPDQELEPEARAVADSVRRERPPWEAEIPFERLRGIPVLIVSGGWDPAFDAVCDVLEERLGAERAVLPGNGHAAQHAPEFNERLLSFWESCG